MSEKILKALLQLFAIIAKTDSSGPNGGRNGRDVVERFLRQQFNDDLIAIHLSTFDTYVLAYQSSGGASRKRRKRTSLNSVKVLKICTQINEELTLRQKFVVLLKLLELVYASGDVEEQEYDFVTTVAETFNIGHEDFKRCFSFVDRQTKERIDEEHLLYIDQKDSTELHKARHINADGFNGELRVLHIPSVNLYLMRYLGKEDVYLNGQFLKEEQHYILANGSSVKPPNGQPIYYSDIMGCFLKGGQETPVELHADSIEYRFPNGNVGLQELSLHESSGKLIGIMGGSGSGKSTLLNVLNGNLAPTSGQVLINGVDVHNDRKATRGVIGHVPQDDLLIEELSVFQNLFFNAKLCFGELEAEQVTQKVLKLLHSLGLYETKDLKVGSSLDKSISGGQRKRLNIALELIREPTVLFVDEPTSGLSSRDSENIMDLLKELALTGRLVFTVIHQPSSDIYKMFDKLLIMDQGGYPVYYGNPVSAVVYFKKVVGHVNADESQCNTCGNVTSEQIFDILEAKLVDEHGNETDQRRISPGAWNEVFRAHEVPAAEWNTSNSEPLKSKFSPPGLIDQFKVFLKRDVLAKLANHQYVLINLIEAPALAFVMTFFLRYFRTGPGTLDAYVFRHNENIPQYLFIAVIVALFLGLTVSAEEIIRDRKIRQREKFLDLSPASYLLSKVGVMFAISAIQTLLFVLVANQVLDIKDMTLAHWLVLFSTSCFANMLGLNISASFNSAKVIYIIIPVMIIPQLLFSGIIVKFDKLHPWFASEKSVPLIGNVMASRWAYEALAVTQFMDNEYEEQFYSMDQRMKYANWKKDLWVRELKNRIHRVQKELNGQHRKEVMAYDLDLIRTELTKEEWLIRQLPFQGLQNLAPSTVDHELLETVDAHLDQLVKHYRKVFKKAENEKEALIGSMTDTPEKKAAYFKLLDDQRNESLADFVTNKNDLNVITEFKGELVQKSDPIYLQPYFSNALNAQFYAPVKNVFGNVWSTLVVNMLVIWAMSIFLMITLYYDVFPRSLERISDILTRK